MYTGLHVKYLLLLSDFNQTCIFSTDFRKTLKYQISRKSVQLEQSCFRRTDGRTHATKLIVAFRNFTNAPKSWYGYVHLHSVSSYVPLEVRWQLMNLTHSVSVIKTNQLMLYMEIIAVCSQSHTKHVNKHEFQSVPRCKHTPPRL
jgi:hypothetical protein